MSQSQAVSTETATSAGVDGALPQVNEAVDATPSWRDTTYDPAAVKEEFAAIQPTTRAETRWKAAILAALPETNELVGEEILGERITPLMFAAAHGRDRLTAMLLTNGAKIDEESSTEKKSALIFAAERGHTEVAKMLVESGANVNKSAPNGDAVSYAERNGYYDLAVFLWENGTRGRTPPRRMEKAGIVGGPLIDQLLDLLEGDVRANRDQIMTVIAKMQLRAGMDKKFRGEVYELAQRLPAGNEVKILLQTLVLKEK